MRYFKASALFPFPSVTTVAALPPPPTHDAPPPEAADVATDTPSVSSERRFADASLRSSLLSPWT